nr:glycosyltransferase family 9 protein [uncultured Mucilaginibacter sp.]
MAQNRNLFRLTRFILLKLPYLFRFFALFRGSGSKRLLIIKTDAIGDYILVRNFIAEVKRSAKYRNYEVELLGNAVWQDLALAYDSGVVSKFYFTKALQLYYYPGAVFKLGWQLFKRNYEVVLNPSSTRIFISDGLAALCAAKETIGFESNTEGIEQKYKAKTDKFYTRRLNLPATIYHEFHRNKFFFQQVLGESFLINKPSIPVAPKPKAGIIIFPGAGLQKRGWESEKFAALIKLIRLQSSQTIYIAGGANEAEENALICQLAASANVVDITGKTTLPQLAEMVAAATLIIGNDSGAIHLAVALDTPSVCITGGGHFDRFVPYPADVANGPLCVYQKMDCYYCNWNCIYQTDANDRYPCVSIITVDMAWQAIKPLLLPA